MTSFAASKDAAIGVATDAENLMVVKDCCGRYSRGIRCHLGALVYKTHIDIEMSGSVERLPFCNAEVNTVFLDQVHV